MFHLDYLSCFLTVLATILLARKSWIGLLIAIVNSLIVCAIGLRTSQLGFIPANLFCICAYAFSMRSWLREQTHTKIEIRRGARIVVRPRTALLCSIVPLLEQPQTAPHGTHLKPIDLAREKGNLGSTS